MLLNLPVSAGSTGTVVTVPEATGYRRGGRVAVAQFKASGGSGTIQIQGSLLPVGATGQVWTDLLADAFTDDGAENLTIFPFYRSSGTGTLDGTLTVMV